MKSIHGLFVREVHLVKLGQELWDILCSKSHWKMATKVCVRFGHDYELHTFLLVAPWSAHPIGS